MGLFNLRSYAGCTQGSGVQKLVDRLETPPPLSQPSRHDGEDASANIDAISGELQAPPLIHCMALDWNNYCLPLDTLIVVLGTEQYLPPPATRHTTRMPFPLLLPSLINMRMMTVILSHWRSLAHHCDWHCSSADEWREGRGTYYGVGGMLVMSAAV